METKTNFFDIERKLASKTVGDMLLPGATIISVPSTATLEETLSTLSEHKILSCPVIEESGEIIGLVDMFDLVCYILDIYLKDQDIDVAEKENRLDWRAWLKDISKLIWKEKEIGKVPVLEIIDASRLNPYYTAKVSTPLPKLLYIFQQGLHRVVAVDDDNNPVGIVSQSNVLRFIARYINLIQSFGRNTNDEIGLGMQEVVSIPSTSRAIHAFYKMKKHAVSAVAIVNPDTGKLEGSISLSDLRGLKPLNLAALLEPVFDFLKRHSTDSRIPPMTCHPSTTFETVVLKLAATGVHRLWNVTEGEGDEMGKPLGVIALTDVMKLLDLRVYVMQEEEELKAEDSSLLK